MSVKTEGKKNLFLVVTCGEPHTFETLDAIKKETTIPFKLQIWYALKQPLDLEIYQKFLSYTDDVIVSSAKHPFGSCQGWAMIYNDYDYLWVFGGDCKPLPGYVERIDNLFHLIPYTVSVGNVKYDCQPDFSVSDTGAAPDLLQVYDRIGVNILGGTCPSFRTNGHEIVEMGLRIVANRFQFISTKGLVEEIGPSAPKNGSHNDYYEGQLAENLKIVEAAKELVLKQKGYNWWNNNLIKEAEVCRL